MSHQAAHKPFELDIPVAESDIDQLGHVNNVVYLRWVQEAAIAHWMAAATPEEKRTLLWVVVKHEIEYKRPAFAQDEIMARTWIGGASPKAFERHTEILRRSDGKLLARALTLWCPIDFKTRRPVEVGAETQQRFSVSDTTP